MDASRRDAEGDIRYAYPRPAPVCSAPYHLVLHLRLQLSIVQTFLDWSRVPSPVLQDNTPSHGIHPVCVRTVQDSKASSRSPSAVPHSLQSPSLQRKELLLLALVTPATCSFLRLLLPLQVDTHHTIPSRRLSFFPSRLPCLPTARNSIIKVLFLQLQPYLCLPFPSAESVIRRRLFPCTSRFFPSF